MLLVAATVVDVVVVDTRNTTVVALEAAALAAEVVVGLAIGSVVVLADAAHQAVDALGLLTALVAVNVARRPASRAWSYGSGKADALGGFVSAPLLLGSVTWITVESIRRLIEPEPVASSERQEPTAQQATQGQQELPEQLARQEQQDQQGLSTS